MKNFAFLIPALLVLACSQPTVSTGQSEGLLTAEDSLAYGIGINIGKNLSSGKLGHLNADRIAQGIRDVLDSNDQKIDDEKINALLMAEQMKEQQRQQELAAGAKKAGDAWLVENALKDGVQLTQSGLQYKVLVPGNGPIPTLENSVKVHYSGTLIDGTKFDSSYDRGEPATFAVTGVIKGWTEALTMMPVGSRWQVFIPSELGYGEQVRPGGKIPANAVLIFEMELLEIVQ